jgi:hypothetical protein
MRATTTMCAVAMCVCLAARAGAGDVALDIGDAISLEAQKMTLRQALVEISEAVPFTLVERGTPPEEPVSLAVEAKTWQGLFRKLLGRESHLLTLDRATGKPTQLVVRWDAVREFQAALPAGETAAGAGDIEARIRASAEEVLAPPDVTGEAIARIEDARDAFEAARGGPDEAEAKEAYLDAIGDLNAHDEARAVEALVPALEIDDRDARLAGLETLRELSHTGRTPTAVDAAMSAFETADDDTVERAALEVLVRYGDQREVMRLLEPLALSDGPNRDIAVREWIRIRDEEIARQNIARTGDPQLRAGQ